MTLRANGLFFLFATLLLAAGCPSQTAKGPAETLDAYREALDSGNFGAAYGLMSEEFRTKHTRQEFVAMMKANQSEVAQSVRLLQSGSRHTEVSAELQFGLGDTMTLVQDKGVWRVATNPVLFYSMVSPREALRSFVRAYRHERWDVMLRYVPNRYAEKMTAEKMKAQFDGDQREEIAAMMNMLEANISAPIEDKGNEARMPYGDRYEVKFVREDGLWKIQDFD